MSQAIATRLRAACALLRTTSMPLADLIPLLQVAADELCAEMSAEAVRFTIRGEPAAKGNQHQIVTMGGHASIIKSKKARSFESVAILQIPPDAKRMISGPVAVSMRIWYGSARPDLDESVMLDCMQAKFTGTGAKRKLVRAGVYLNDRQVFEKHVFKGIDPTNPRVEIEVSPISQAELLT